MHHLSECAISDEIACRSVGDLQSRVREDYGWGDTDRELVRWVGLWDGMWECRRAVYSFSCGAECSCSSQ